MKRLALLSAVSLSILGGCAVYPVGPGVVAVAPIPPRVVVGPPAVFVGGPVYHRPWYGSRPYHRHHHHHW